MYACVFVSLCVPYIFICVCIWVLGNCVWQCSLQFFKVCVRIKFLLCNILSRLICIWSDVYEICAKAFLEGTFICNPRFLVCARLKLRANMVYVCVDVCVCLCVQNVSQRQFSCFFHTNKTITIARNLIASCLAG